MIFDETNYSNTWAGNFPLTPAEPTDEGLRLPRIETHYTLGGVKSAGDRWRFEPGLGTEFELSHTLLLQCGFKLTFANDQVFELLHTEPGVFIGQLPARAAPELFAADQQTQTVDGIAFLSDGAVQVGLFLQENEQQRLFVLCVHEGDRASCAQKILSLKDSLQTKGVSIWKAQLELRQAWAERLPENLSSENPGWAIERLQGLVEPASGIFQGPWIRDPSRESPTLSFQLSCNVISALAVIQPEAIPGFLRTLLNLPAMENGAWAAHYTPEGSVPDSGPALPVTAGILTTLPREAGACPEFPQLITRCKEHLQSFLSGTSKSELPQWPHPQTAFTPEVTDPESLIQFDLAAMLVTEIEALQKLTNNPGELETERNALVSGIWSEFWSDKQKRLLDKTTDGTFASRVTAAALLPLLWNRLNKQESTALRQCLLNTDELRTLGGLRQWQPKKDDPLSPPVHPATQQIFLPLLGKLPGEVAALLSADWHRSLQQDPEFQHPETAAMQLRLIPFASRVNPHLERYPAWVRSMEKHRQVIVAVAAAIIFLVPAGFGIYFTVRSDYNRADELLQSGHAETLTTMGDLEAAAEVYTQLLTYSRMDSRKNIYYLKRGDLRFNQGEFGKALDDYLLAVERDPLGNLYKARWNLAQTYARLDRMQEAVDTLQEFIDEYGGELPAFKLRAENAILLWQK